MSLLEVRQIGKREGGKTLLADISFTQERFQHIAIAGATGSGKTTLLRSIAGLVQPTEGEVLFEGVKIKGPEEQLIPGHPSIAYLSQHYELRNHYHVEELIEMNNHLSGQEAYTICSLCRIDHLLKRWTHQLSGGEKQRIALACLLVGAPKLLLLDEPFSNLDVIYKTILKEVIDDISHHLEMTCMLVAHDPLDVLPWAEEIVVLREGRMVQSAPPEVIYREPADEYVAGLFGKYNKLTPAMATIFSSISDIRPEKINGFLRPEDFQLSATTDKGVKANVQSCFFMGSRYEVRVVIAGEPCVLYSDGFIPEDEAVYVFLR
jgi:ABC-type Fe3+/spermidine/putrescine transport system ATPase subunit